MFGVEIISDIEMSGVWCSGYGHAPTLTATTLSQEETGGSQFGGWLTWETDAKCYHIFLERLLYR